MSTKFIVTAALALFGLIALLLTSECSKAAKAGSYPIGTVVGEVGTSAPIQMNRFEDPQHHVVCYAYNDYRSGVSCIKEN